MKGLHLTADLYRCRCDTASLWDASRVQAWARQAAQAAGLPVSGESYQETDAGAAVALLLDRGHVCVHTWPGQRGVTLDVYVGSGDGDASARARGVMDALVTRFQPEWTEQRSLDRGDGDA